MNDNTGAMGTMLSTDEIYQQFNQPCKRILSSIAAADQVDDLTQEAFAKISRGLPTFAGNSSLSTWIYRIIINTGRDWLRHKPRTHHLQTVDIDQNGGEQNGCSLSQAAFVEPVQQVIRLEINACIREQINKLPEIYREVIILSSLQELKKREIAEILDLSLETVKIRLHRGREKLKVILEQQCRFYQNGSTGALSCDRKDQVLL